MNLVEQKNDDVIFIEPLLVISRLAQLSAYSVGHIIHIVDGLPKIVNITKDKEGDPNGEYLKYKINELILTIEQLWEPIIQYIDWYKSALAEIYRPDYKIITVRAIQGVQKIRDLAGSRLAIEAMLSRILVLLADSCDIDVPGGLASKRSPYVGCSFGIHAIPELALSDSVASLDGGLPGTRKIIERIDFKSFISLLNQYDSTITESEEEQEFVREAIDSWITCHFP
jgi:hypothetical protein